MYGVLLFLHIIGATIWTGGHIVLSVVILPNVLKAKLPDKLIRFESAFEKIGMPALVMQIITGVALAYRMLPDISEWFNWSNPFSHIIIAKFCILFITVLFAIDAKLRVLPNFNESKLIDMAWHIVPVTILSILFVAVGVSIRTGWLY